MLLQANVVDVCDNEVLVKYVGDWVNGDEVVRLPMSKVRLPPTHSTIGAAVEYPAGSDVEVYDTLFESPGPAFWKASLKVRIVCLFQPF